MKKTFLLIILFCTLHFCDAQSYTFETIDKRTFKPGWEIKEIPGSIFISENIIVITTAENTKEFKVQSSQQFLIKDNKIFCCLNEFGRSVNLILSCQDQLRKYFELCYYSDEPNEKYYRYCLTKI